MISPPASAGLGLSGTRVVVAGAGGLGHQIASAFAGQDAQVAVIDANAGGPRMSWPAFRPSPRGTIWPSLPT